jgi:hypothetical protein
MNTQTKGMLVFCGLMGMSLLNNVAAKSIKVTNAVELYSAVSTPLPGDTIWLKGGEYAMTSRLNLLKSGTADKMICLLAETPDGCRPVLNFSGMEVKSSNQGVKLQANYWHIKGIDITKAGDAGLWLSNASNNTVEYCCFYGNNDTGMQIDDGSANNLVLNCDSYQNMDPTVENADGFACKVDVGNNNKFVGCRAWNNLDDGWDGYLKTTDNITTSFENCWAVANGMKPDGTPTGGDGNGFKSGGSDDKLKKHNASYTNCIAAGNLADGFDHNSNRGVVTLVGCKAAFNKNNINFSETNPAEKLIMKNCTVLGKVGKIKADSVDATGNSWELAAPTTEASFLSVDVAELTKPRLKGGQLPKTSFLTAK